MRAPQLPLWTRWWLGTARPDRRRTRVFTLLAEDQNAIPSSMMSCGLASFRSTGPTSGFWRARIIRRSRRTST